MNKCVKEMQKTLDSFSIKYNRFDVLRDAFECMAIAISNQVDWSSYDEREKRYLEIVSRYDKSDVEIMATLLAQITTALSQACDDGFADFLGELYMASNTSNKLSGQFFTPYDVSRMGAEINLSNLDKDKDIITFYEPACGSGGMILACMDVLWNKYHINYTDKVLVVAGDVDSRCVNMAYIQLSLAGVPAIVEQRDALSMKREGKAWYTPAYMFQYTKFRNVDLGCFGE